MDSHHHHQHQRYRLLVLGGSQAGKTCVIRRYLQNTFSEKYKETVEDIYPRDFHIGGCLLPLDIYDTNFYYPDMRRVAIASADAFAFIFAVDDVNSFKSATELVKEVIDRRPIDFDQLPVVLVGNKSDAQDKKIYRETVQVYLRNLQLPKKSIPYFETSAKTGQQVPDIFKSLLDQSGFPNNLKLTTLDSVGRRRTIQASPLGSRTPSMSYHHQSGGGNSNASPSHPRRPPGPRRQMSQISVRCLSGGRNSISSDEDEIDNRLISDRLAGDSSDQKGLIEFSDHANGTDKSKDPSHRSDRSDHSDQQPIDNRQSQSTAHEKRQSRFYRQLSMSSKRDKLAPALVTTPGLVVGPQGQIEAALISNSESDHDRKRSTAVETTSQKKRGVLTRHGSLMKRPPAQRLSLKMKRSTIDEPDDESDCKIS